MSETPFHVVMIITGLRTGGAEGMLERLVRHLPSRVRCHVISLSDMGEIGPRLSAAGVAVEAIGMVPGRLDPVRWWRLVRRLRALRPDVVHTWMYHADLLGGLAARAAGVRCILWGVRHTNLDPHLNKRSTLYVARACAWLSSLIPQRIACVAEVSRTAHRAFGYDNTRMVVIPNGFDLQRFAPDQAARIAIRTELSIPPTAPLVGLMGRFDPQKNHRGFAAAASVIRRRCPDAHFILAGSGIDYNNAELVDWLRHAGVLDACHLLGRRDDMPQLLAALDVLVSSSVGEGFSNVIGEAMACGVPCAVTDVGDSAAIIAETGRAVSPSAPEELGAAVADLLTLPAEHRAQLGERARRRAREQYDIGTIVRLYEDQYRAMLRERIHHSTSHS